MIEFSAYDDKVVGIQFLIGIQFLCYRYTDHTYRNADRRAISCQKSWYYHDVNI